MCRTKYEFDADDRKRFMEKWTSWIFHMKTTHGIDQTMLEIIFREMKKDEKTN